MATRLTLLRAAGRSTVGAAACAVKSTAGGAHRAAAAEAVSRSADHADADLSASFGDSTLGETLLAPTEIYVNSIAQLAQSVRLNALAHITGGGFTENIPRVLPDDTKAIIDLSAWQRPAIFDWLQTEGNVDDAEMLRTFNCGIGMIACLPKEQAATALALLADSPIKAFKIGRVEAKQAGEDAVVYAD